MANRYSYPDPATAFTNAFMNSFTPFLQARLKNDADMVKEGTKRILDNYDKASEAVKKQNALGSQYTQDAQSLIKMLGPNTNGIPPEKLGNYASQVIRWHDGDVVKAYEFLNQQLSNNVVSRETVLQATDAAATSGTQKAPMPEFYTPDQTQAAFSDQIASAESSGKVDAWNVDRNGNLYGGLFQFGDARLEEVNAALGTEYTAMDLKMGKVPASEQKRMGDWHFGQIDQFISEEGLDKYIGTNVGGVTVTRNGMKAVAHLGGNQGLKKYLESGGVYNPHDGKVVDGIRQEGTYLSDYMGRFGGGDAAAAVSGTTSTARSSSTLAEEYNLSSLSDVSIEDQRSIGERVVDGVSSLFNPNDQSYILTAARREAKRQLSLSGDLQTYEDMVSGKITLAGNSGGVDGLSFNPANGDMEDFPSLATIGSQKEIDAIRIGVESGLIRGDANEMAALDLLEAKFAGLPQGLPADLMELTSEQQIKNAKTLYDTLSPDELAALPMGYGTRLSALFATVDQSGGLTVQGIFDRLTTLEAAATREGATQDDKDEYGLYVNQSLVPLVNQALATSTDVSVQERMGVLSEISSRVVGKDGVSDEVGRGLQSSFERIRSTADAAANPEGSKEQVVVSDGNGGFEYREIITKPTLGGTTKYYIGDDGREVPFDGASVINMPEGHIQARTKIANQMQSDIMAYENAVTDNRGFLSTVGQMGQLIANDENLLGADLVNQLGGVYVDVNRNVEVATSRLSELNGDTAGQKEFFTSADAGNIIQELERQVAAIEADPMRNNAANFALFKAKQVLAAYKIGRLEGQSGTAMSNRDFENFSLAINAKSAKEFMTGMGAYVQSIDATMNIAHDNLLNDPRVKSWEATINGKVPFFSGGVNVKRFTDDFDMWSEAEKLGYKMFLGDPVTKEKEETTPDWTFDPNSATLSFD